MIQIGNPSFSNQKSRRIAERVIWSDTDSLDLETISLKKLANGGSVLDIAESSREISALLKKLSDKYQTLDINSFESYPDIHADLCNPELTDQLSERYDLIVCKSILEHVYDPLTASSNLYKLLKPGGIIVGSVPFMFPRHCPPNLEYQDYYRFTPEALGILFQEAVEVRACPTRGRLASSLIVFSMSYKYFFERKYPKMAKFMNALFSKQPDSYQTSTIDFCISA